MATKNDSIVRVTHPVLRNKSVGSGAKGFKFRRKTSVVITAKFRSVGSYTPNNATIYDQAYAGFLSGVYDGKDVAQSPEANTVGIIAQAVLFAQSVDTLIAAASPTVGQATFIGNLCQSVMANKYAVGLTEADFDETAEFIANLYADAASGFQESGGGSGGGTTNPPYTQSAPLGVGDAYTMKATDTVLYVQAGSLVTLPATPILGVEILVKIVSGTAEATPARVFSGGSYGVENPGNPPYNFVTGSTAATMGVSAACNGWVYDGTHMNQTR